ncbi:acetylornithine aminotransferase [Chytridiales sp. JEL 0842]|nr:acetylornithine aminotransferase [Chytridiales sp. JEL 0842]
MLLRSINLVKQRSGLLSSLRFSSSSSAPSTSPLLPLYPQPKSLTPSTALGCRITTTQHETYLDFTAGIAVTSLGHSHPKVVEALRDQAGKVVHVSNLFENPWGTLLGSKLLSALREEVDATAEDHGEQAASARQWWGEESKVFFCNSGTEANEAAIKFARKQGKIVDPTGSKFQILSFHGAFHGRTMGALSATPNAKYQKPFEPMVPGFINTPFNDIQALESLDFSKIAGVLIEPIQGEGGVRPATAEFLKAVHDKCRAHQTLLIFDEIQCGLLRTGSFFAHRGMVKGVNPDLITLAKPLANGVPIGAVLLAPNVASNIKPGDHGTTFGGNPLATRVGCVVVDELRSGSLKKNVAKVSAVMSKGLNKLKQDFPELVSEIRGRGFIMGIALKEGKADAGKFTELCREMGKLLVVGAGMNTVRCIPPLVVTEAEVEEALEVFRDVLTRMKAAL